MSHNTKMDCVRFQIQISAEDYLSYYSGHAKSISTLSDDGRRIEFPAEHLRDFVTAEGISGYFELCFNEDNRFKAIKKIA